MLRYFSLLFLLITVTSVLAQSSLTSEQLYGEAVAHFTARDYTAASASLDKIPSAEQNKADILNLRGAIYKRLGELDNAANAFKDALNVNPKDWIPKYNTADIEFLRKEYKSSRSYLEQALASMPEADRVQKQDLILYKVYLTYLLEGDNDKAKLLLENFDQNSANPVFYYAQAAWSYQNNENDKAATWIESTDGLYSEELRNSYSQALVDLGWLKASEGIGTTLTASSATPSATATATATPAPTEIAVADIVPLASDNATPIPVTSIAPVETPAATTPADISQPPVGVATGEPGKEVVETEKKRSIIPTLLAVLAIFAIAGIFLVNLARKTRIVPAPTDNTGYDAIAATASPDGTDLTSHRSEGTGPVIVQEAETPLAAAPIKVTPIHREYEADTKTASTASGETASTTPAPKITRKVSPASTTVASKTAAPKAAASKTPSTKTPASSSATRTTAKTPAKTPAKTVSKTTTPATQKVAAKTVGKIVEPTAKAPAGTSPAKSATAGVAATAVAAAGRKTAPKAPVSNAKTGAATATTPTSLAKQVAVTVIPAKAGATKAAAPKAAPARPVTQKKTVAAPASAPAAPSAPVATAEATDSLGLPKGTKAVPIVTENFPLPDGGASLSDLTSKVGTIVLATTKKTAPKPSAPAAIKTSAATSKPAPAKTAPAKATPAKAAPAKKSPASATPATSTASSQPTPSRPVAPLITIPEFEDANIEITSQPLRLIPNQDSDEQKTS